MAKSFFGILAILIFGSMAQSMLPWWSIVFVAGFAGALFEKKSSLKSFLMGFFGVLLLWSIYAFIINSGNEGILATRMGQLFNNLGGGTMIIISGIIGGLVGGFGSMTGTLGRKLLA